MNEFNKPGQMFDGRYELLEVLGAGGLGTVFKAIQVDLGRQIALKILHPNVAKDEELCTRFMREAQALHKLSHRSIVSVYHIGLATSGQPYIAMELVNGRSARQILNEQGKMPCLLALKIVRETALALQYVHESGIVHRDLKPENIIIVDIAPNSVQSSVLNGVSDRLPGTPVSSQFDCEEDFKARPESSIVKLIDFGLAKTSGSVNQKLTKTGELIGTCMYMSPEQCQGLSNIDARTDIYSLCACLYEFVTGEPCFIADTAMGVMYKHANEQTPVITQAQTDRSLPELNRLIARGMAKQPEKRFQSMAELSDELSLLIEKISLGAERKSSTFLNRTSVISMTIVFLIGIAGTISISLNNAQKSKTSVSKFAKKTSTESKNDSLPDLANYEIPSNGEKLRYYIQARKLLLNNESAALDLLLRWEMKYAKNSRKFLRAEIYNDIMEIYIGRGDDTKTSLYLSKVIKEQDSATTCRAMTLAFEYYIREGKVNA